jgi:hypothetical protein
MCSDHYALLAESVDLYRNLLPVQPQRSYFYIRYSASTNDSDTCSSPSCEPLPAALVSLCVSAGSLEYSIGEIGVFIFSSLIPLSPSPLISFLSESSCLLPKSPPTAVTRERERQEWHPPLVQNIWWVSICYASLLFALKICCCNRKIMSVKYVVLTLAGKATCRDTLKYMIQIPSMSSVWVAFILCLICFFC